MKKNLQLFTLIFYLSGTVLSGESIKVSFWNVENLFDLKDDPKTNDNEFAFGGKKNVTQEIYDLKLKYSH
jgi:hypothetical protein